MIRCFLSACAGTVHYSCVACDCGLSLLTFVGQLLNLPLVQFISIATDSKVDEKCACLDSAGVTPSLVTAAAWDRSPVSALVG